MSKINTLLLNLSIRLKTLMHQTNYRSYLIEGNDAFAFLQGQFSCDMEEVSKSPQAGAYCLPDGKVLAFFLFVSNNSRLLAY